MKTSKLFKKFKCFSIGHLELSAFLRLFPQLTFCSCTRALHEPQHPLLGAEEGKTKSTCLFKKPQTNYSLQETPPMLSRLVLNPAVWLVSGSRCHRVTLFLLTAGYPPIPEMLFYCCTCPWNVEKAKIYLVFRLSL